MSQKTSDAQGKERSREAYHWQLWAEYKEGLPEVIITDNGPEFAGRALDEWAYQRKVKLCPIEPGKPVENDEVRPHSSLVYLTPEEFIEKEVEMATCSPVFSNS